MINAVKSEDGSFTAFSSKYNEHYHSTRDGALNESLYKHVIPALLHVSDKKEIAILDICFGLGFNTLATLYYLKENNVQKKVTIISPELDGELIASLEEFQYPEVFTPFLHIIQAISGKHEYKDENFHLKVVVGDARQYLLTCKECFDIVYQDAFSPSVNPMLWTKEYFKDISKVIKDDGILTTYSMALKTRLALYENGFNIYLNSGEGYRNATVASKSVLDFPLVDMQHKIACNPDISALSDIFDTK
ncbi:MAG: MnmC family methyltransferase [Campylobacterota bacterium]|nr:MnmC family methyltransferase [Campylobacterota bacterium]